MHRHSLIALTPPVPEPAFHGDFFQKASFGRAMSELVDDEVISSLVRDSIGGINQPVSAHTKMFLDRDPATYAIRRFVENNENLIGWFANAFPYVSPDRIQAHVLCCGLAFRLEGYAYGEFVRKEGIRQDGQPASFGVILTLDKIPAELRSLVVVVNRGDGKFGERHPDEVHSTQMHEVLHILFNRFFSRAPFISSSELSAELKKIEPDNNASFIALAHRLGAGMVEVARSEMISYCAQGNCNPDFRQLCGNFWKMHFEAVHDFLNSAGFNKHQRFAVIEAFWDAFHIYRDTLQKLTDWVRSEGVAGDAQPDLQLIVRMLRYNPFGAPSSSSSPQKPAIFRADSEFRKAA